MQDDYDNKLTRAETDALSSLPRELVAPKALENHTVAALKQRGLLASKPAPWWMLLRVAGAAAALAIAFFAGTRVEPTDSLTTSAVTASNLQTATRYDDTTVHYLFLYTPEVAMVELTPSQMQERMAEYMRWVVDARAADVDIDGRKLGYTTRILRDYRGETLVANHDIANAKGALGGFFVIYGLTTDQVSDLARTCPHLKYGGIIEVRDIDLRVE